MEIRRCPAGHFYDADQNSECPTCERIAAGELIPELLSVQKDEPKREPKPEQKPEQIPVSMDFGDTLMGISMPRYHDYSTINEELPDESSTDIWEEESYSEIDVQKNKDKCRKLKALRQKTAELNDIPLEVKECTHEGPCKGTCVACDMELMILNNWLRQLSDEGVPIHLPDDPEGSSGHAWFF